MFYKVGDGYVINLDNVESLVKESRHVSRFEYEDAWKITFISGEEVEVEKECFDNILKYLSNEGQLK